MEFCFLGKYHLTITHDSDDNSKVITKQYIGKELALCLVVRKEKSIRLQPVPCGKKRKKHKIATHKRKKRLRMNRHKKK